MSAAGDVNLTAQTPRARRRRLTGQIMEGLATAAALLAVAVLAIVLISVAKKGVFPNSPRKNALVEAQDKQRAEGLAAGGGGVEHGHSSGV